MKTLNQMAIGESMQVGSYVVVRQTSKQFRLGEVGGDWITSGEQGEISQRLGRHASHLHRYSNQACTICGHKWSL